MVKKKKNFDLALKRAEAYVGVMARVCRSLLHQAGAPRALWAEAITFIYEVKNLARWKIDGTVVESLILKLKENDETAEILLEQHRVESWSPWGDQVFALLPLAARDSKLSPIAIWVSFLCTTEQP